MAIDNPEHMVNLALQGGGAHGAFTWGVLDRLLEDGRVGIEAISGTSAGAMNAVVLADGFMDGGEDGAREHLAEFWKSVSKHAAKSPIRRNPVNILLGDWGLDNSASYLYMDLLTRLASPYELNPLNLNPLRDLLESTVDMERVHSCNRIKLFISATNVHTGRVRVFKNADLSIDAIMASACLPFLFHAVEIDGVPYWDGGYMGNPVLHPFYNSCTTADVLLVQINPVERRQTPRTAREILNRVNEITFNSSLLKEFRAIEFVSRLIEEGKLDPGHYKNVHLHCIQGGDAMQDLSASSKMNAEWRFLKHLHDLGRAAADRWLDEHYTKLGVRSSYDVRALFGIGRRALDDSPLPTATEERPSDGASP